MMNLNTGGSLQKEIMLDNMFSNIKQTKWYSWLTMIAGESVNLQFLSFKWR